ncbi:PilZ domain-containing protein [Thermodesulfobacteriota bacterium]
MVERIFLDSENHASFLCPQCQKLFKKDLTKFINHDKKIIFKCQCPCGHSFPVLLDRRRYPRKDTDLRGAFIHDKKRIRGAINIKNVSLGGLGFELGSKYLISTGDILLVRFNLDDVFNTMVSKEALIKKIKNTYIGAEFLERTWKHDLFHLYLGEK